jgi:hypothetical protein
MKKKVILTEQQHNVIINHILKETVEKIDELEAKGTLDEGFWDAVKYGLSKLGRYKAGGKIFGKGEVDTQYAEKIKDLIAKQNNQMIKKLDDLIRETNPQFPNNEDPQLFLQTVMEIAAVYDSIVAATKIPQNKKGSMDVTIANEVIEDLRQYVKKYLDVDLKAIYSVTNEEDISEEDMLTEEQLKQIDEYFGLDEALPARRNGGQVGGSNQGPQVSGKGNAGSYRRTPDIEDVDYEDIPNNATQPNNPTQASNPLNAKDVRAGLQGKRGDGEDFGSTRMDTLKSNKLPMTLAGIGSSLGAFSWLVNTEWFKSLFDVVTKNPSIEYIKQAVQEKTDVFASIKPNEGMTQIMNRLNGMNLNPNSSPQEFISGIKTLGGGNVNAGIDALTQQGGIFADPEAAKKALTEIVSNANGHGSNLGQIFQGQWAGTGESFGDSLVTQTGGSLKGMVVNTIIKAVPKLVLKTGIKTGAGYALAKGFGAVLGPIGIGLVTAGAIVKLMRMKGQKSSRAATLNALYQSLRDLDGVDLLPDEETGTQDGGAGGTGGNTGGGQINKNICNTQNLEELNKILKQVKDLSQPLKQINDYKKLTGFNTIFLDSFINTTKSVKINGKPLLKTLQDLNSQGLLEEPDYGRKTYSMSGSQRKSLKFKLDLQNFMASVMKLFSSTYKGCKKTSKTYQVIKNFFKQLFIIASQGKSNITDEQTRNILFNKLIGNFEQFLSQLNKLPDMERGTVEKTVGTPKKTKNTNDGVFAGSAPRTKPQFQGQSKNQQAPAASPRPSASQSSPTGQNVVPENLDPKLMEEIKRIKKIMLS